MYLRIFSLLDGRGYVRARAATRWHHRPSPPKEWWQDSTPNAFSHFVLYTHLTYHHDQNLHIGHTYVKRFWVLWKGNHARWGWGRRPPILGLWLCSDALQAPRTVLKVFRRSISLLSYLRLKPTYMTRILSSVLLQDILLVQHGILSLCGIQIWGSANVSLLAK